MTAAARLRRPVAVALLGRPDAAREQLRQALIGCGADVVYEDDLAATAADALQSHSPQVVLINLEPGLEEDFDHLQPLLDDPQVSVVFNEGEVSSQLAGWDLARWARHLASKVLGGGETTPPRPAGLEALPSLNLQPTPGRPLTPAQQAGELRLETYTLEAVDRAASVPYSEQPAQRQTAPAAGTQEQGDPSETHAGHADSFLTLDDSDLEGVDSALRADPGKPEVSSAGVPGLADAPAEPEAGPDATVEAAANHLRGGDFSEGTTELSDTAVTAEDGLAAVDRAHAGDGAAGETPEEQIVQSHSGSDTDSGFELQWEDEPATADSTGAGSSATSEARVADAETTDFGFDLDFSTQSDASEADDAVVGDEQFDALERAFGLAPGSTAGFAADNPRPDAETKNRAPDDENRTAAEGSSNVLDLDLDLDFSATAEDADTSGPANDTFERGGHSGGAHSDADPEPAMEMESATPEADLSADWNWNDPASESGPESAHAQSGQVAASDAAAASGFDYQQFDDVSPSQSSATLADGGADSDDGNDEQLAELLASFDAQSAQLPEQATDTVDEFDFSALSLDDLNDDVPDVPEKTHPPAAPAPAAAVPESSSRLETGQLSSAATGDAAQPAEPAATPPSVSGLSLMPMDAELPSAGRPAEAPVFDFSKLEMTLEPIDGEEVGDEAPLDRLAEKTPSRGVAVSPDEAEQPPGQSTAASVGDPLHQADIAGALAGRTQSQIPSFESSAEEQGTSAGQQPASSEDPALLQRVIVLGASIGGPDALRSFLAGIPAGFPALFVLAQHLENGFFERLAQQLQKGSKLPVRVPQSGESARHGEVLVVTSSDRLLLAANGAVDLLPITEPPHYRPCIDDVLRDVADRFGSAATAIIFSGMAADAIEGAAHLASLGGEVWVQDPQSCVVSSMVDGAQARGIVEFVGSPRELADHCVERYG